MAKKLIKIIIGIVIACAVFVIGVRAYFRLPVKAYYDASKKAFVIPDCNNGFIAQGLDYSKDDNCFFVTGYMKDESTSPIYVVENDGTSNFKKVLMKTADGADYKGHCGGISVHGDYVYVAGSEDPCLVVFSYEDIKNAENGSNVTSLGEVPVCSDMGVAFVTTTDDAIYAGEFYREGNYPTPDSHKITTVAGDYNQALMVGYKFSDAPDAIFGVAATPFEAYSLTDLVQGAAFKDNRVYASTSWGVSFSTVYAYDLGKANKSSITIDGTEVPLTELDSAALDYTMKIPPMSEEIVFVDGKMYTMCESASDKYIFGKFTSARWCYSTDLQSH